MLLRVPGAASVMLPPCATRRPSTFTPLAPDSESLPFGSVTMDAPLSTTTDERCCVEPLLASVRLVGRRWSSGSTSVCTASARRAPVARRAASWPSIRQACACGRNSVSALTTTPSVAFTVYAVNPPSVKKPASRRSMVSATAASPPICARPTVSDKLPPVASEWPSRSPASRLTVGAVFSTAASEIEPPAPPLTRLPRATLPPPETSSVAPACTLKALPITLMLPPAVVDAVLPSALAMAEGSGAASGPVLFSQRPAVETPLPLASVTRPGSGVVSLPGCSAVCRVTLPAGARTCPATRTSAPPSTRRLPAAASRVVPAGTLTRPRELISTLPKPPCSKSAGAASSVSAACAAGSGSVAAKKAPRWSTGAMVKVVAATRLALLRCRSVPSVSVPPRGAAASWPLPAVALPRSVPSSTRPPGAVMASVPAALPSTDGPSTVRPSATGPS